MSNNTLIVMPTGDGKFMICDGSRETLALCPCCGLSLNETAAHAVIQRIEEGEFTFETAKRLEQFWRKA